MSFANMYEGHSEAENREDKIKQICAGGNHSMILTQSGTLYAFGYASSGQLGTGTIKNSNTPQPTKSFLPPQSHPYRDVEERVISVALGQNHSIALSNLGFVYCCGSGKFGQLGLGDFENTPNFTQVMQ